MAGFAWKYCVICLFVSISCLVGVSGGLELPGQVSCYQCVSYSKSGQNDLCPFNASVDAIKAGQGSCAGKCFTHDSVEDSGVEVVSRGCSSTQWGLPDPLPKDGCYRWKSQTWCLCSHDGCNGVPLGPASNITMNSHLHGNETDTDNSSTSFLPPDLQQNSSVLPGNTLCWQCVSDMDGQHYDNCPVSASVDVTRAYIGDCTGRCFMRSFTVKPGDTQGIVRGCTATQWGLPNPLPVDGCYTWRSQVWCICSQHGCNGARMGLGTGRVAALDSHLHVSENLAGRNAIGPWQCVVSVWLWRIIICLNFRCPTS